MSRGLIPLWRYEPRDIEHLTDELKESLKKSDKERLLEDRRHIERDMRIALEKTKLELHL